MDGENGKWEIISNDVRKEWTGLFLLANFSSYHINSYLHYIPCLYVVLIKLLPGSKM